MRTFDELWRYITKERPGVITVQERSELEHVFNLMRDCDCSSYLEIGTAEGNSLYVLAQAMVQNASVTYIDLWENHTADPRGKVENILDDLNYFLNPIPGDSTEKGTYQRVMDQTYDCVLIDGGHDYTTVLSDAILYAPLATKYIFFHDIQLPEVREAVEWWHKRWQLGKYSEFINSDTFGFGIVEIRK